MKLKLKIILISLTLSLIYASLFIYSLTQIIVPEVQLNSLEDVNLNGFRISGNILLKNDGLIPIKVGKIKYNITLDFNGEKLSEGELNGGWIFPGKQKEYFFSNKIFWTPSASLGFELLKPGSSMATIDGFIYLVKIKFLDFKIPFSQSIDLKDYISQFTTNFLEDTTHQAEEIWNNVIDFFN